MMPRNYRFPRVSDVALLMPLAASGVGFLISVMYSKPSFLFFLTTSLASAWYASGFYYVHKAASRHEHCCLVSGSL